MTVILVDRKKGMMGSDSQSETRSLVIRSKKIRVLDDGSLCASSGDDGYNHLFDRWKDSGFEPEKAPNLGDADTTWLVLTPSRDLWMFFGGARCQITDDVFAIGTGGAMAFGAYAAGATMQRALEIACEHAPGCGKGVDIYQLPDSPHCDTEEEYSAWFAGQYPGESPVWPTAAIQQ